MDEKGQFETSTGNQGDSTAPAGIESPGTFIPGMSQEPNSVDQKTEKGRTGKDG
jgi:hypothetical protein